MHSLKNEDIVELTPNGMFGERDDIQASYDYADLIAGSSESYIHSITPWFVLYNTIAKKYYLIPKDTVNVEENDKD